MDDSGVTIDFVKDGHRTSDIDDAHQVRAFTADGNILAVLERHDPRAPGFWTPVEAPGFAPGAINTNVAFATEAEIRTWIVEALA